MNASVVLLPLLPDLRIMQKMGKNCEFCTEWQEHWYWSHMADENKHFFKLMVGDFTESMSIPDRFAKNFNGHISEEVNLKSPSGKSWSIEVASDTGDVVLLRSGWTEFVSAHSIEQGGCLLFKYSGPSSFDVLMLDSNGCEKTSPHPVKNHGAKQHRILPELAATTTLSAKLKTADRRSAKTGYCFCKNGPVAGFHLTEEDKEEISSVRVPVEPSNPVFVQVMHTGHVRNTTRTSIVGISSEFAGKYMGAVGREMVLKSAGRRGRWHARFVSGDYCRGLSGCGWRDFLLVCFVPQPTMPNRWLAKSWANKFAAGFSRVGAEMS